MPVNEDLILTGNLGLDIAPSRLDTLRRKKTAVSYEECGFLDCSRRTERYSWWPGAQPKWPPFFEDRPPLQGFWRMGLLQSCPRSCPS